MDDVLIECSPGISGDMLLGAFYDLGVPQSVIEQPLVDLGLEDLYQLDFEDSKSCSIRGIKAKVENIDCGLTQRNWRSIKQLILNGNLEEKLKQISGDMLLAAFYDLGVPKKVIEKPLFDLGLTDRYTLEFKESKSCSIRGIKAKVENCLLYTSPSPRDRYISRMPSSA